MTTTWGIDRASVDGGSRDYAALKRAGASFAWIRCSYGAYDSAHAAWRIAPDPDLRHDWNAIASAGLVRGAYIGPAILATHSAEEQVGIAKAALDDAGGLRPGHDFPICIDLEFPYGIAGTHLDRAGVMAWLRAAVAECRRVFGCWPIIYTSGRVWNDVDSDCLGDPPAPDLVDCPLWLARYAYKTRQPAVIPPPEGPVPTPVPTPWGDEWHAHQDQGDALGCSGFSSTVDVDRFRTAKLGDVGGHVAWAQRKLGGLTADGSFGPKTDAQVKAFQTHCGLTPDGVIGPRTFAAIAVL